MKFRVVPPDFFVSPIQNVWRIDEAGEALVWRDVPGTALLLAHLQKLCQSWTGEHPGLPSLTAMLFIVDALSQGWTESTAEKRIGSLADAAGLQPRSSQFLREQLISWLVRLKDIDPEFRRGHAAHAAFLGECLENLPEKWLVLHRFQTETALQWLENIAGDCSPVLVTRLKNEQYAAVVALNTLEFAALQAIDPEALRRRMRTGLDALPVPQPLEVREPHPIAAMVKRLASESHDLATVAQLAQVIGASLTLPRMPSDPDVLPIGGVSDVVNRGQPDRLLISELAMDSDLLIARIANGQALYLRREQPPKSSAKRQALLVEAGIRMWGSPRLHAAAFALGVCLVQERRGGPPFDIVTVAGKTVCSEDLTTPNGLEQFYGRLMPDAHPGEALKSLASHPDLSLDMSYPPILVLSESTDRHVAFQDAIRDWPRPYWVARVTQEAWVELIERSLLGDTGLQRIKLELPPKPAAVRHASLSLSKKDKRPMFLRLDPCPLRYATPAIGVWLQTYGHEQADQVQHACWLVKSNRRVMVLNGSDLGAIEVGFLPSGRVLASHVVDENTWLLVLESKLRDVAQPQHLLVEARAGRGITTCELGLHDERFDKVTYCFDRGQLIRIGDMVTFLDTRTGAVLATDRCLHPHRGGPFFGTNPIYVVCRNGEDVDWHCLGKVGCLAGVIARGPLDAPVCFSHDLTQQILLNGDDPNTVKTGFHLHSEYPVELLRVSGNGMEALLRVQGVTAASDSRLLSKRGEQRLVRASLHTAEVRYWSDFSVDSMNNFELKYHPVRYHSPNLLRRVRGLSFAGDQMLVHTRGSCYAVTEVSNRGQAGFRLEAVKKGDIEADFIPFEAPEMQGPKASNERQLRYVRLPEGQAWMDSRGLLHLQARDESELSLVLCEGLLAGWSSQYGVFGPRYFIAPTSDSYQQVTVPMRNWLRKFCLAQH